MPKAKTTTEDTTLETTTTPEDTLPEVTTTPESTTVGQVITTTETLPSVDEALFDAPTIIIPDAVTPIQNVSLVASTEHRLLNGEFVETYFPCFEGEAPGTKASVTINGYVYWFEKGKQVRVPKPVADVYHITVDRKLNGSPRGRALLASRDDFINAFK